VNLFSGHKDTMTTTALALTTMFGFEALKG
jgi:hypothetical protein